MKIKLKKFFYKHKIISITAVFLIFALLFFTALDLSTYIPMHMKNNQSINSFGSAKSKVYVQKTKEDIIDNTLSYYKNILENNNTYVVDGFEITVFLSKDNKLIVSQSSLLDDFTDCRENPFNQKNVSISSKTIGELKQYNAGYYLNAKDGYPYRKSGMDLSYYRIITLDELIVYLNTQSVDWKKPFNLIINIGDKNNLDGAITELSNVLSEYNHTKYSVVITKSNSMIKMLDRYPEIQRTASYIEVINFYYKAAFFINNPVISYDILYLEPYFCGINFCKDRFTNYAKYCNIPIVFKDVNTTKKIQRIALKKPDGIAGFSPKEIFLETIK
ncbi:MAG: hypothetical protein WC177_06500 [Bacilli bacterium]